MTHTYILTIDGGQTHSLAIIADQNGHVLGAGNGGPANHFLEPGGSERFQTSMRTCIERAFAEAKLSVQRVAASYYSLTGVHDQMRDILQQIVPSDRQVIAGDKNASLAGATSERPAVLVLAGTGAIAFGIDKDGREAVTGGWGYLMGDEGSASWIAPQALSAATRAEDGRGPATSLVFAIPDHFRVESLRTLHPLIYMQHVDRVKLAGIAQVVGEAAAGGDVVSTAILAEAGGYLGTAAVAVIRELALIHVPVIITSAGGVFKSGRFVIEPMMKRIHEEFPFAHYKPPRYPPIIGALLLALQSIHIPISNSVIDNIEGSQSVWNSRK
jgi:N-acetylglucosamine kinase-like BadF-type ATPase